jgi:rhodanese-related sulfurtransferase
MKMLSPKEVLQALEAQESCCLIDIREPYELLNCKIDCPSVPMATFAAAYPNYLQCEQVVLMCQSGRRAEALANFMETEYAATNIYVLEGGINAWIEQNAPQITCQ